MASALAMKVLAGVTTSSPGPTPTARSASSRADVPESTPTACATPQYAASSSSKAATSPPRMKSQFVSTRAQEPATSAEIASTWGRRSTNGMRKGILDRALRDRGHAHGRASGLHGHVDGLEHRHDVAPKGAVGGGRIARPHAVEEMHRLVAQRLAGLDPGAHDVPVPEGELELAEGHGGGPARRAPRTEHADALLRVHVVEDDALVGGDDDEFAHL